MQTFNGYKYDDNTQTLTIGRFVSADDFDIDSLTEFDIEHIKVDEKNSDFIVKDNVLFNKNGSIILYFPNEDKREEYIVPNGVKHISYKAFYGTDNLKKVTMNNDVESIGGHAFEFSDLEQIKLSDNITSIGQGAFTFTRLSSIKLPDKLLNKNNFLLSYTTRLESVVIPDGVKQIGKMSFSNCGAKEIVVPESVTYIHLDAFSGCDLTIFLTKATLNKNPKLLNFYGDMIVVEKPKTLEELLNEGKNFKEANDIIIKQKEYDI